MSMREDLEDITALAEDVKGIGGLDSRFAEFLRENGPKLLLAADQMFGPLTGKYGEFLRPFVALMERELFANAGKGDREGWLRMTPEVAVLEIHHHVAKLQRAVLNRDIAGIREYAADVANMSMMAVDVCGALLPGDGQEGDA